MTSSTEMPIRFTSRALIVDENKRVLLTKISKKNLWVTIGGEVELGETFEQAVKREIFEETGITEFTLSPCIAYGEHVLLINGIDTKFHEKFFIAYTNTSHIDLSNLTPEERMRKSYESYKWWEISEMVKLSKKEEIPFRPKNIFFLLKSVIDTDMYVTSFLSPILISTDIAPRVSIKIDLSD